MMNINVSFLEGGLQDCLICGIFKLCKCRSFGWFWRPFRGILILINFLKIKFMLDDG
jgi:hypothetical protein